MNSAEPDPTDPASRLTTVHGQHRLALRYAPVGADGGLWHDITDLGQGRLAVAVGRTPDPALARRLGAQVGDVLRATGDPFAALAAPAKSPADSVALCAVIDRSSAELTYSCLGGIAPIIATPDAPHVLLAATTGAPARVPLPPAATVLLCTAPGDAVGAVLDECANLHPEQVADRIVAVLPPRPAAAVALLYRNAPGPLELTVPALPASLATVRSHLRHWLALTGVDAETAADTLLAVGEAASNATEHSVLGAGHPVDLTVSAAVTGDRLRFTVADNGCWKPPPDTPGHRGHGIRLINALVDDADLVTDEQGTTVEMVVEMVKETRR